jgi:hypothetical protein
MNIKEKIQSDIVQLADDIKLFVNQKDKYWRALPYFVVWSIPQSDTHAYCYSRVWKDKILDIGSSARVDLSTGELFFDKAGLPKNVLIELIRDYNDWLFDGEKQLMYHYENLKKSGYNINAKWRQKLIKQAKIEIPHTILLLL